MGKKMKKDEKPPPDDVFHPLLVESRQAATVVLMLKSPEEDVQSKACEAIYKFVDKCDENKKMLLELSAVESLLHLMQSEDVNVRRHSTMAMGIMCQHADVRHLLQKNEGSIPTFIRLLQTEDIVVSEFAALAIAFMTAEFCNKVAVFNNGGIEPLVKLLSCQDPDVKKNTIEALAQLSMDYDVRCTVKQYDGFPLILDLLKSDYAVIQKLALLTLDRLMLDVENRSVMRSHDGISQLLEILSRPEWNDLHVLVVMVLSSLLEDLESIELMKESGGLKKLVSLITDQPLPEEESKKVDKKAGSRMGKKSASKDVKNKKGREEVEKAAASGTAIIPTLPDVKMCAATAIARCARNCDNRKLLHELEVEKMLISLLSHESPDVQGAAAFGLGVMSENATVCDSIREWEGFQPLVKLLNTANDDTKEYVTLALANLTASNTSNCQEIVRFHGLDNLITLLSNTSEEAVSNAACVLTNIAQTELLRANALAKSVVTSLIVPLRSSNANVQSKVALAVSAFVCDSISRREFRENDGLDPLVRLLNSGNSEVRRNAAWAISVVGVDESTATAICKLGGLELLQQMQLSRTLQSPFVDVALEKLLDSNLSAKYALTGSLSQLNVIEDGFYDPGQMRMGSAFMTLDDYIKLPMDDKRPVFYISAKLELDQHVQKEEETSSRTDVRRDSKTSRASKHDSKGKSRAQREKEEKQREEELAAQLEKEVAQKVEMQQEQEQSLPSDPNFIKYVAEVTETIMSLPSSRQQIVTLAKYVADKMGGPVEKDRLTFFSWELPLSQIKFDMKSNVIPIGKVKIGIHIHRALLFKPGSPMYPQTLFIVDLMHQPGTLLLPNSQDTIAYMKI